MTQLRFAFMLLLVALIGASLAGEERAYLVKDFPGKTAGIVAAGPDGPGLHASRWPSLAF
jgi:hypothetical protein